jgi:ABC-type Mn2+/Zn2+ transport system permease subunit
VHRLLWQKLVDILENQADNKLANYIFYMTLGLVIAFSIKIAGVLLIFTYLIASAISGISWFQSRAKLIIFSVLFNIIGSIAGIVISYLLDLPTGATIVCVLIALVMVAAGVRMIKPANNN